MCTQLKHREEEARQIKSQFRNIKNKTNLK